MSDMFDVCAWDDRLVVGKHMMSIKLFHIENMLISLFVKCARLSLLLSLAGNGTEYNSD